MAGVSLRGVQKSYGDTQVIHGVDCEIADGEFLVIVGPSGCGKSTLLRMVAGLEAITDGEIAIGERTVNKLEPAERDIAMVFQNYALYPHMTVYRNMAYGLQIRGMAKDEIERRVKQAAEILELTDEMLQRKPRQLSGGQRQRVAMGRAIVREPSAFLFDEPLSNLDAKLRVQMRIEIKRLQADLGITSIYVTHDQVEAMTLGHRLMVLNAGRVEQLGSPMELYERPASTFVAGFIGSPAMNIMPARVADDGTAIELPGGDRLPCSLAASAELNGREITLGIRPEHFFLTEEERGLAHLKADVVEQLGADTLVHGHFGTDKKTLTARFNGLFFAKPGDSLPLSVESARLHIFDPATGQRIAKSPKA